MEKEEMLAAENNFNDSAVVVDDVPLIDDDDEPNNSLIIVKQQQQQQQQPIGDYESFTPHPHVWINVKTFAEGIGGWSTTLLELLRLANSTMGISIVEPCMFQGRLGTCVNNNSSSSGIPVSEIFDLSEVLAVAVVQSGRLHPIMIPHHEYNNNNMHNTFINSSILLQYNICMSRMKGNKINPIPITRCPTSTLLPQHVDLSKASSSSSDGGNSSSSRSINIILNLEDYWMNDSKLGGILTGVDKHVTTTNKGKTLLPQQLSFHQNHINTVERILNRVNITGNDDFSVIHWRAEKVGMDYIDCANAVLNAKIRMMEEEEQQQQQQHDDNADSHHSFVLLTSLNYNASKMWTGSRNAVNKKNIDTVKQALDMLLADNQFIAFDNLLSQEMENDNNNNRHEEEMNNNNNYHHQGGGGVQQQQQYYYHDSGMLAIYDLILAIKSRTFASCARDENHGCDKYASKVCDRCNHIGKFGKLAISLRRNFNMGTSWGCWPQPKKMV